MFIKDIYKVQTPRKLKKEEELFASKYKGTLPLPHDMESMIGLEIEVENGLSLSQNFGPSSYWNMTTEESLRNNGVELVSNVLYGHRIPNALDAFKLYYSLYNLESSHRTGIHIHVDFSKNTIEEIIKYIFIYLVLEDVFFLYIDSFGFNRKNNNNTVPLGDCGWLLNIQEALFLLRSGRHDSAAGQLNAGEQRRYSAINFASLSKFGTLEFRQFPTVFDPAIILNWINIILSIKEGALKHTLEDLKSKIYSLNTTSEYYSFISKMTNNYLPIPGNIQLNKLCETNVTLIKSIYNLKKMQLERGFSEFKKSPYYIKYQSHPEIIGLLERNKKQKEKITTLTDAYVTFANPSPEFPPATSNNVDFLLITQSDSDPQEGDF